MWRPFLIWPPAFYLRSITTSEFLLVKLTLLTNTAGFESETVGLGAPEFGVQM